MRLCNSISSALPYHCSQQEHGNVYVKSQWQLLLVYHYLYMVPPSAELSTNLISPRFTACLSVYKGMGQGHMFSRGVDGTVIWRTPAGDAQEPGPPDATSCQHPKPHTALFSPSFSLHCVAHRKSEILFMWKYAGSVFSFYHNILQIFSSIA